MIIKLDMLTACETAYTGTSLQDKFVIKYW